MLNRALGQLQEYKLRKDAKTGLRFDWRTAASWEKIMATAAFIVGCVMVMMILSAALNNQNFDDRPFALIRGILALASAAFIFALPGFISVNVAAKRLSIRAAGAFAVFVIVYMIMPAIN
jgi:uncharacterized membrane protein